MSTEIILANTDEEILACLPVMLLLRPNLTREEFVGQVRRQQAQAFQLLALKENGDVKCVLGFREAEYLIWGKTIYIDDLSTVTDGRGKGYAGRLMDWVTDYARAHHCKAVHLDSGFARHEAHRFYLNRGFTLACHHFYLEIPSLGAL
jgi:GNAT superfamily N-acetyltransferase